MLFYMQFLKMAIIFFSHLEAQVVPADPFVTRIPYKYFEKFEAFKVLKNILWKEHFCSFGSINWIWVWYWFILKWFSRKSQTCFQTSPLEYESFLREILKWWDYWKRRLFNNPYLALRLRPWNKNRTVYINCG